MQAIAQDTLPNFTVRELAKGKVQVSWINPFDNVVQMIVQRSYDSTKYFRSIFSSQSPWLPQNGFVDNNVAKGYKVFYRVQYVFEGGEYFFTKSKSPDNYVPVKVIRVNNDEPEDAVDSSNNKETSDNKDSKATEKKPTRYIKVYKVNKDTLVATIEYKDYKRYRDSIMKTTKDTLQSEADIEMELYDNGYISFLDEIPENLIDYMDWDQIWRECNIAYGWVEVYSQESGRQFAVNI
jgi:hypothetical protein